MLLHAAPVIAQAKAVGAKIRDRAENEGSFGACYFEPRKAQEELMTDPRETEEIAYDQASLTRLKKHYAGLRDKASYDAFLRSARALITKLGIDPYYIRMALTGKHSMLEFGSRAAYQHAEVSEGVEVGLLIDREDTLKIPRDILKHVHQFKPDGVDFVTVVVPTWSALSTELLALNEKAMTAEYKRQYGKKLVEQRRGSGTDNEAMRFAVVQGTQLDQMKAGKRYWAVGFDLGGGHADLKPFLEGDYWEALKYRDDDDRPAAKEARELFDQISIGDYFLIKGYGGSNDLVVHYVGEVTGKDSAAKRLRLKRHPVDLFNGKAPTGQGGGNWRKTILEVTRPQDIALLFKRGTEQSTVVEQRVRPMEKEPLNVILYGPPGTGKTHTLRNNYFERFTTRPSEVPRDQRIFDAIQDLTWWEVIGVVLLANGPSNVDGIMHHELVQAKAAMSRSKNVRATIWSNLQFHTVNECSLVKYEKRSEPLIFNKKENSVWEVLDQAVDESYPELRDQLDRYRSDYQEKGAENKEIKRYEFVTFHQAYTYEDFIEGLKPQLDSKEIAYEIVPGIFKRLCERAERDPDHDYALFIDEINRGNIAAIFGELITLIEEDKRLGATNELRATLPYSKPATFGVPANVRIVGTMNTADRSVEALDTALRRRFSFVECPSKPEELEKLDYRIVGEVDLSRLLTVINARLEMLLDCDHHIGHSYFMNWGDEDKEQKLRQVFKNNIVPLLQEYFYGDPVKVGLVLGDKFVRNADEDKTAKVEFASAFRKAADIEPKSRYVFQDVMDPALVPMQAFKDICDGK